MKTIKRTFDFSPDVNGGESLVLVTEKRDVGNGEYYFPQQLILSSYENSATINLWGITLTPAKLRKLARELEMLGVR